MLVNEAVEAGWEIEAQYVAPGGVPVATGPGTSVNELAEGVIERVASTAHPQPLLAVVRWRPAPDGLLSTASFVVVVDQLADPGNAGTILRSAEAAGADAVVLTAGSVDPTNPKVVRASAGALFHVPTITGVELTALRDRGLTLIGASSHRGAAHTATDLRRHVALVLGSEAHGLHDDAPVDEWVTIPHAGRSESLNVAMAATVLCFELARQRRA